MKNTFYQYLGVGLLSAALGIGLQAKAQMVVVNVGINQPAALVADAGNTSVGVDICWGDSVTLGGSPAATGGMMPYGYAWSPANDLTSTIVANPMAGPTSTITYNLMVQDANNCTSSSSVEVRVNPSPAPIFTYNVSGANVTFNNLTSPPVTTWLWDFGDGGTSTLQFPTHTYVTQGQHLVCLTANYMGCTGVGCTFVTSLVGIEDAFAIPGLMVFPNPYQGRTNVQFSMTEADQVRLEAFDVQGKLIGVLHNGMLDAGKQQLEFSAAALGAPAGVYLLRLTIGDRQATLRVHELH